MGKFRSEIADGNQRGGSRVNDYQESPSHHIPVDQTDTATLTRQTPQSGDNINTAEVVRPERVRGGQGPVKVPQCLICAVCCVNTIDIFIL